MSTFLNDITAVNALLKLKNNNQMNKHEKLRIKSSFLITAFMDAFECSFEQQFIVVLNGYLKNHLTLIDLLMNEQDDNIKKILDQTIKNNYESLVSFIAHHKIVIP